MVSDAVRGHHAGGLKKTPEEGYHLLDDMTEKAMNWISTAESAEAPNNPFFVYFAPARPTPRTTCRRNGRTSTRASSSAGWDALRDETFARQKKLGVIPGGRPAHCAATRNCQPGSRCRMTSSLFCGRQMEVYTGLLGVHRPPHWSHSWMGWKKLGIFDDTLIYYIIGDNGASSEGGHQRLTTTR